MNILLLSPRLPKSVGKADSFTVYHLAKYLTARGHSVHVVSFIESGEEEAEAHLAGMVSTLRTVRLRKWRTLLGMGLAVLRKRPLQVGYYWDRQMKRYTDDVFANEKVDLVYAHLIRMAEYIRKRHRYPGVLGMQISQTLNYARMVEHTRSLATRLLYRIELTFVRRYEIAVIKDFEKTFLISPNDCRAITGQGNDPAVTFMPHGIDVPFFAAPPETTDENRSWDLVFNGDMGVATNIDSMVWFAQEILPIIWEDRPSTTLCIVGRNPAFRVRALGADDRVTVTGGVADMRPFLHGSKVAVDPLRIGAGMQNKVLVSMAAGLPVVCTSVANEGIRAPVGEAVVIANQPSAFANATLDLLKNPRRASKIGKNGQRFVSDRWTWDYHHRNWETSVQRLVARER